jgi:hypothetical protein
VAEQVGWWLRPLHRVQRSVTLVQMKAVGATAIDAPVSGGTGPLSRLMALSAAASSVQGRISRMSRGRCRGNSHVHGRRQASLLCFALTAAALTIAVAVWRRSRRPRHAAVRCRGESCG